jgi:hypothetical protein
VVDASVVQCRLHCLCTTATLPVMELDALRVTAHCAFQDDSACLAAGDVAHDVTLLFQYAAHLSNYRLSASTGFHSSMYCQEFPMLLRWL